MSQIPGIVRNYSLLKSTDYNIGKEFKVIIDLLITTAFFLNTFLKAFISGLLVTSKKFPIITSLFLEK
jgi:hypothetical protein